MAYYGFEKATNIDKSIIDWSGITKKISDDLLSVKADRDKQRSDLEDKQSEELKKLEDLEMGGDVDMNNWTMAQAQNTRDYMKAIHQQMKDGIISVDQAKRIKQGVMGTWDIASKSAKGYQDTVKRLSETKGKGNEALLEIVAMNADLKNKKIVYDAKGSGFYVDMDENGEIDMDTAKPVSAINNIQKQTKVYVDVDTETTEISKNAPKIQLATGSTTSIEDALQSKEYRKYIDNVVDAKTSDDDRLMSIGLDYLNMEYDVTGKDTGSQMITYNKVTGFEENGTPITEDKTVDIGPIKIDSGTGKPTFTDNQRSIIKEAYKNAIIGKLDRVTTEQYVAPQKKSTSETKAIDMASNIEKFVTKGDFSAFQAALDQAGYSQSTAPDDNGIMFIRKPDGTQKRIDTNGTAKEVGNQIAGALGVLNQFGQRKVTGGLSNNVLTNKDQYGIFSRKTKVSTKNVALVSAAFNPEGNVKIDNKSLLSALQIAGRDLGVQPNRIKIDGSNIMLDDQIMGTTSDTGPNMIKKLEDSLKNKKSGY